MCIIDWCNENDGFLSAILAVLAIFVPFRIAHTQNRIALFEKRLECYQQLIALKGFADYVSEIGPLNAQEVYQCKQKYLYIHGVLADERHAEMSKVGNVSVKYAKECIDKDSELFTSIELLIKVKNENLLKEVNTSLQEFIKDLFAVPSSAEKAGSSRQKFVSAFKHIDGYCEVLHRNIKMHHSWCAFLKKAGNKKNEKT